MKSCPRIPSYCVLSLDNSMAEFRKSGGEFAIGGRYEVSFNDCKGETKTTQFTIHDHGVEPEEYLHAVWHDYVEDHWFTFYMFEEEINPARTLGIMAVA